MRVNWKLNEMRLLSTVAINLATEYTCLDDRKLDIFFAHLVNLVYNYMNRVYFGETSYERSVWGTTTNLTRSGFGGFVDNTDAAAIKRDKFGVLFQGVTYQFGKYWTSKGKIEAIIFDNLEEVAFNHMTRCYKMVFLPSTVNYYKEIRLQRLTL